ncbi:MAG TPA: LuxR C-terminal-related transcriptional regulator [Myxococcales bacterium]|nr:LuxR C-terminal-related transcriptional regulator [Myxococcales bacterium]
MRADLLHVVESAYDLDGSGTRWLQGLTDAIGPLIDAGHGAYGTTIDASDLGRMNVGKVVCYRGDRAFVRAILETNAALARTEVKDTYRGTDAINTATERVGAARWNAIARPHGPSAIRDCTAVVAADARGVGCMVIAPMERVHRYPARVKRVWARVVAHVVAMQRLRAGLAGASPRRRAEGEAVLSPGGALEHAIGSASSGSARALLREAAVARERARGQLRREAPEEAVEMWHALVAGRWSIVDRFDRDGRRFLIAHENEPVAMGPRALTARERQVVTQVAMGHSNKLVAYELGLSVGAVSAYLNGAMRKLGLDSRLDLARLVLAGARAAAR